MTTEEIVRQQLDKIRQQEIKFNEQPWVKALKARYGPPS